MTSQPSPDKTPVGQDRISRAEIGKDALQSTAEATAQAVGEVAVIVTNAVKDVATAIGGLATEVFEIRDSARKAAREADKHAELED
ncbi:hypothetical protein [Nocardioides sp.]|uniref:hypothetical protein n=1 Tax=Nocardioides sp. TaxID=35761 RepID=UPI003515ADFA